LNISHSQPIDDQLGIGFGDFTIQLHVPLWDRKTEKTRELSVANVICQHDEFLRLLTYAK
jgi:hypothetical protein